MADQLIVKLGADTSEFKSAIARAGNDVQGALGGEAGGSAGSKFVGAFEHKLLGARHLSGALATALGLNIEHIAENLARLITGVSKEEEENLKELAKTSDELREKTIKAMQESLTAEQLYQAKLIERDSILKKLSENEGKNTKEQLEANLLKISLIEKQGEIQKLVDEQSKKQLEEQGNLLKWVHDIKEQDAKDEAARLKKIGEEDLAWYKKRVTQEKELHDLKLAALTPEQQLTQLQGEQLALNVRIKKEKRDGVDTIEDEIKSLKIAKDIEEAILAIIEKQAKAKKEAAKAMNPAGDLGVAKSIGGYQTYNNASDQKAYEQGLLNSARREIANEIDSIQRQIDELVKGGSSLGKYEIPGLQARIKALQGRSQNVQDFVFNPNYKDAAGQGLFAQQVSSIGDPLKLQTQQIDETKKISTGISDLNERLRVAGFGTGK